MSFSPLVLSPPQLIVNLAKSVSSSLESLSEAIGEGVQQLESFTLDAALSSTLSSLSGKVREEAEAVTQPNISSLTITPYLYTVGDRVGEIGYLTAENALKILASRFAEQANASETNALQGLIVVLVGASSPKALADALSALASAYPIEGLEKAVRRAKSLASLEKDKFIIPRATCYPSWRKHSAQKDVKGKSIMQEVCSMVATSEGLAKSEQDPASILKQFGEKQIKKVQQKTTDLRALLNSFSGQNDSLTVGYFTGTPAELAKKLRDVEAPFGAECKQSTLFCLYGSPLHLAFYKELFGC